MPINAHPEYIEAEKNYLHAQNPEEKLRCLEKMISTCPSHKGAEKLKAQLNLRYKKLRHSIEKQKSSGKSKKIGIKKAEMQAVIVGLTNSGKSSLLSCLTNANPEIASYGFTTKIPKLGTLNYEDVKIQLIDLPAIENELCDQGIINTADTLLIVTEKIEHLKDIFPFLNQATSSRIIVHNKSDLLNSNEKRKITETLKSKKYNFVLFSSKTKENISELLDKIWRSFNKIRIYTKEPGKPADKDPIVLNKGATVKDVAEKILHGFSKKIKETRITGPSSKFPNQKVALVHVLKDKDIVEFYTR